MQYVPLGRSGLKVSPVCLGTMMFGGAADEAVVAPDHRQGARLRPQLHRHRRRLQFRRVGRDRRPRHRGRSRPMDRRDQGRIRGTPKRLLAGARVRDSAEESAQRLQTDRIDIYYLHKEDHATPLEETIGAIADLSAQRRHPFIRRVELSRLARRGNLPPVRRARHRAPDCQPALLQRAQPHARDRASAGLRLFGLGVFPYSPIARGVLTGKYRRRRSAAGGDARRPQRQADDANRVASGIARDRANDQAARRKPRHQCGAIRGRLGTQQPPGHRRGRRSAHRGATRRLCARARLPLHT